MLSGQHCDQDADPLPGPVFRAASSVGRTLWLFVAAVFVTLEGGEAINVEDGDYFNIVNNSAPNARVHVIVSEQSRFILNFRFDPNERQGTLQLKYLEPVGGKTLTDVTLKSEEEVNIASSRMDLGGKTVTVQATYVLANGQVVMNATLIITPFSYTGNTICSTDWDCRRFKSNCSGGFCQCGPEYKFHKRQQYCARICSIDGECDYLGTRNSQCFLKKCACSGETKLVAGQCSYAKGCTSDSICTGGAFCESTRCLCPAGTVRQSTGTVCSRLPCATNADCAFWMNTECGRQSPGSKSKGCRCSEGTAVLMGSCNPIDNLGPCPYGRCAFEYSHCDSATRTCQCDPGYELHVYGKTWICEKQDIENVERSCKDAKDCYAGEICEDEVCKCPKKYELKGLECVEITIPRQKSNLLMLIIWLSVAMLALIVAFMSFGCCLYLLAQRAENEQMAIVRMIEGSAEEELS